MIRAVVDPSVLVSAFIGDPDAAPGRLVDRDLLDAGLTDIAIERPAALLARLREPSG